MASRKVNAPALCAGRELLTKDGSKCGNGIILGSHSYDGFQSSVYQVLLDDLSIDHCTEEEVSKRYTVGRVIDLNEAVKMRRNNLKHILFLLEIGDKK